jgi:hypothetical protein
MKVNGMTEEPRARSREFLNLYDPIRAGEYRFDMYGSSAWILKPLGK